MTTFYWGGWLTWVCDVLIKIAPFSGLDHPVDWSVILEVGKRVEKESSPDWRGVIISKELDHLSPFLTYCNNNQLSNYLSSHSTHNSSRYVGGKREKRDSQREKNSPYYQRNQGDQPAMFNPQLHEDSFGLSYVQKILSRCDQYTPKVERERAISTCGSPLFFADECSQPCGVAFRIWFPTKSTGWYWTLSRVITRDIAMRTTVPRG